jgi:hypothetical protein
MSRLEPIVERAAPDARAAAISDAAVDAMLALRALR